LALTLQRFLPLWEALPFLQYIQFPWRFISVALPLIALFSAWWASVPLTKPVKTVLYVICFGLLAFTTRNFEPEQWLEDPEAMYSVDPHYIQGPLSRTLVDYVPVGFVEPLAWNDFPYRPPGTIGCLFEECKIETVVNTGHQLLLNVSTDSDSEAVSISRSYFPGWKAEINGESAPVLVGENASMLVQIPKGQSMVGVQFGRSPEMLWGDIITMISVIALLYFVVGMSKTDEKK